MSRHRKLSRPVDARTFAHFRRVWSEPAPALVDGTEAERRSREFLNRKLAERVRREPEWVI